MYFKIVFFLIFAALPLSWQDLSSDQAALISLRSSVRGRTLLWNVSEPTPCSWAGIVCGDNRVTVLRLPAESLFGQIPRGIFGNLTQLRTLSLRMNALSGSLPSDLALCINLRNLYLQGNMFSGEIPDFLFGLTALVRLNLATNKFSGRIPSGLSNLKRLRTLFLESNQLSASLPDLGLLELDQFNVSNNNLNGSIPKTLEVFDSTAFLGNNLCGRPLGVCSGSETISSQPTSIGPITNGQVKKNKLSGGAIAGIVIACLVGLALILLGVFLFCKKKGSKKSTSVGIATIKPQGDIPSDKPLNDPDNANAYPVSAPAVAKGRDSDGGGAKKLVFFGNSTKVFDLEDLLRASAEVLGKGMYGTTYKAGLDVSSVVAVKRLRDVTIQEREFKERIVGVGAMDHQNLVPLRAYYYSRDEKLLVVDYMPMGSLSALLHGNKGAGRTPLNWETRSRIALGAARGVEYLHSQGPNVTHGSIKSSNVLLTKSYEARLSDFGLTHLVGTSSTPNRVTGYRAPEVTEPRKVTQKADVYSFGVLLLELLTGKAPTHAVLNDEGVDLPRWVQSIVRDEWTSEVFDLELLRYQNIEDEMVQLLQLAIDCAAQFPDSRPTMVEVTKQIEGLCQSSSMREDQRLQPDKVIAIDDESF